MATQQGIEKAQVHGYIKNKLLETLTLVDMNVKSGDIKEPPPKEISHLGSGEFLMEGGHIKAGLVYQYSPDRPRGRWVFAWLYNPSASIIKAYTELVPPHIPISWNDIYKKLEHSGPESKFEDGETKVTAKLNGQGIFEAVIEPGFHPIPPQPNN